MGEDRKLNRRGMLAAGAGLAAGAALWRPPALEAAPRARITGFELLPVRATDRTVWLFVRLRTDAGLTGLGEASDALGSAGTPQAEAARMQSELAHFFRLLEGRSPLEIGAFRRQAEPVAAGADVVTATAYSALEQALWDLMGKMLDVPAYALLGGRLRDTLPVYANINRATAPRTPEGFAAAAGAAVRDGFRAVKAAPFDGFPPPGSPASAVEAAVENGIACVRAIRDAIGPDVQLMIDCHSFFDIPLAVEVAHRLEPQDLAWYEEPVPPEQVEDTLEIRRRVSQQLAGGEKLYGIDGFSPLTRTRAVHVIMPDVKHCGGLLELTRIAAVAESDGVKVAPHNPTGPVATAASVQVCAAIENFQILEFQWGEVEWRSEVVSPPERFDDGFIRVPDRPGLGIELNEQVVRAHPL